MYLALRRRRDVLLVLEDADDLEVRHPLEALEIALKRVRGRLVVELRLAERLLELAERGRLVVAELRLRPVLGP
jgi:hypothetical protein